MHRPEPAGRPGCGLTASAAPRAQTIRHALRRTHAALQPPARSGAAQADCGPRRHVPVRIALILTRPAYDDGRNLPRRQQIRSDLTKQRFQRGRSETSPRRCDLTEYPIAALRSFTARVAFPVRAWSTLHGRRSVQTVAARCISLDSRMKEPLGEQNAVEPGPPSRGPSGQPLETVLLKFGANSNTARTLAGTLQEYG